MPNDPLLVAARWMFYLGSAASSVLLLRLGGGLTVGDVLLVGSAVAVVAYTALTPRRLRRSSPHSIEQSIILAMVVFGAGLLSAMASYDPEGSAEVVARIVLIWFVLPWVGWVVLPSAKYLARAAGWLFAGAAVSASGTLLQVMFGATAIPGGQVGADGRMSGWTGHVSDLGGVAAMGFALGVGFILARNRWSLPALVLTGFVLLGLVLSGSVSGMIACFVALIVYMARGAIRARSAVLLLLAGIAVITVTTTLQSASNALDPLERLQKTLGLTDGGAYSTSGSRVATFEAAIPGILQRPVIGHGFDAISGSPDGIFPAHNILIGAAFQGGILFALALVVLLLRPLAGRWIRSERSILTSQLLATTVSAIVFAMTAPSLFNRYLWLPVALLGAMKAIAMVQRASGVPNVQAPSVRAGRRAG